MIVRKEFTGMLSAAILKFEELLENVVHLNPVIVKGYDHTAGLDSFFYWGVASRIIVSPDDMDELRYNAELIGIIWLSDEGDMAFTNDLYIDDFKTYCINGDLESIQKKEEVE